MREKLWLGTIILAILGSQFGLAVIVMEWREDSPTIIIEAAPETTFDAAACDTALNLFNTVFARGTVTDRDPPLFAALTDTIDLVYEHCGVDFVGDQETP